MYSLYSICDFMFDRKIEDRSDIHKIISQFNLREDEFNNISGNENLLQLLNEKKFIQKLGGTSLVTLKIFKEKNPKIPVIFAGAVGEDYFKSEKEHIKFYLEKFTKKRTTICYILIENQHRTMCTNVDASISLTNEYIDNFLNSYKINAHSIFYLCGFLFYHKENKLLILEPFFKKNPHIFLIFNLSIFLADIEFALKFLNISHIIIGNRREFQYLENKVKSEKKLSLLDEYSNKIFLITDSENPVSIYFHSKELKISVIQLFSQKYERVDTCGAGDAFSAGIIEKVIYCLENNIDIFMGIESIVRNGIKAANHYIIQNSISK